MSAPEAAPPGSLCGPHAEASCVERQHCGPLARLRGVQTRTGATVCAQAAPRRCQCCARGCSASVQGAARSAMGGQMGDVSIQRYTAIGRITCWFLAHSSVRHRMRLQRAAAARSAAPRLCARSTCASCRAAASKRVRWCASRRCCRRRPSRVASVPRTTRGSGHKGSSPGCLLI